MRLRALVLPLFALLALALLGACGGDDDDGGVDLDAIDAAVLLGDAADRMAAVEAFRFSLDHENGSSEIVRGIAMETAEGSVAGTDRLQVDVTGRFLALNVEVGVIILPEQSYLRNPLTGNWEEESVTIEGFFDPSDGVVALMRSVRDAEVVGTSTEAGATAVEVRATVDSGELTLFGDDTLLGETVTAALWIGLDDPLVHRIELTGPVFAGDEGDVKRRLRLRDFDADIVIEPPN